MNKGWGAHRRGAPLQLPAAAAVAAALVLLLPALSFPGSVAAQEDQPQSQDVAILTDGPEKARGIAYLPSNVLPHYRARYEYLDSRIEVLYTEEEIVRFAQWEGVRCEGYQLYRVAGGSGSREAARPVFFYQAQEYSLFLQLPREYLCTFLQRFMRKFIYFRSVRDMPSERPPFPAIVD
ncbi:MAG: hypothetical protein K9M94_09840 [Spirochaetia bacterium]|nr:hypothetical protein [Spirochaetia bacterium]